MDILMYLILINKILKILVILKNLYQTIFYQNKIFKSINGSIKVEVSNHMKN